MNRHDPPDAMIELARRAGAQSPCDKSKRGCVVYIDSALDGSDIFHVASGFNGPPARLGVGCPGREVCGQLCRDRCNHAEERALRVTLGTVFARVPNNLVMLHVKVVNDQVVAGGGPGCVTCSRAMLDSGIIHGIWLFQTGHSLTGIDWQPDRWRYWEALDFHRETCMALGIP